MTAGWRTLLASRAKTNAAARIMASPASMSPVTASPERAAAKVTSNALTLPRSKQNK
ncbi:hypothetical protein [Streptomyces curacoi]|uniref:hypothetical protein n=1 Tax=Streptomyces curacoi TaxID=146536 RepID=UPI001FC9ACB6|nr:hypothetical protein [Streptomyces curacoi]